MEDLQQSIYDDIKALNEALEYDSDLSDLTDSEVSNDDSNTISIVTTDNIVNNDTNNKPDDIKKTYTSLETYDNSSYQIKNETPTWTDQIFGDNFSNDYKNGSSHILSIPESNNANILDDDGIFDIDNFDSQTGDDKEIAGLCKALLVNAELMKKLEIYENEIVMAISDNEEYLEEITSLINGENVFTIIDAVDSQSNLYSLCTKPYIKDKNGMTPPANLDTLHKGLTNPQPYSQRLIRVQKLITTNLVDEVRNETIYSMMLPLENRLSIILQKKSKDPKIIKQLDDEASNINSELTRIRNLSNEELFTNVHDHSKKIDWLRVANNFEKIEINAFHCEQKWLTTFHPAIDHGPFTPREDKLLYDAYARLVCPPDDATTTTTTSSSTSTSSFTSSSSSTTSSSTTTSSATSISSATTSTSATSTNSDTTSTSATAPPVTMRVVNIDGASKSSSRGSVGIDADEKQFSNPETIQPSLYSDQTRFEGNLGWEEVARELNTNRTAFQCCKRYQSIYCKDSQYWLKSEDALLQKIVPMYIDISLEGVDWDKVSSHFNYHTREHCIERWREVKTGKKIKYTKWTFAETQRLGELIIWFGVIDWNAITFFMLNRSYYQCRTKYLSMVNINQSDWTYYEDKLIFQSTLKSAFFKELKEKRTNKSLNLRKSQMDEIVSKHGGKDRFPLNKFASYLWQISENNPKGLMQLIRNDQKNGIYIPKPDVSSSILLCNRDSEKFNNLVKLKLQSYGKHNVKYCYVDYLNEITIKDILFPASKKTSRSLKKGYIYTDEEKVKLELLGEIRNIYNTKNTCIGGRPSYFKSMDCDQVPCVRIDEAKKNYDYYKAIIDKGENIPPCLTSCRTYANLLKQRKILQRKIHALKSQEGEYEKEMNSFEIDVNPETETFLARMTSLFHWPTVLSHMDGTMLSYRNQEHRRKNKMAKTFGSVKRNYRFLTEAKKSKRRLLNDQSSKDVGSPTTSSQTPQPICTCGAITTKVNPTPKTQSSEIGDGNSTKVDVDSVKQENCVNDSSNPGPSNTVDGDIVHDNSAGTSLASSACLVISSADKPQQTTSRDSVDPVTPTTDCPPTPSTSTQPQHSAVNNLHSPSCPAYVHTLKLKKTYKRRAVALTPARVSSRLCTESRDDPATTTSASGPQMLNLLPEVKHKRAKRVPRPAKQAKEDDGIKKPGRGRKFGSLGKPKPPPPPPEERRKSSRLRS